MQLYFGLNYSSNAYIDLDKRKNVLFNAEVVGLEGLLRNLELYYGLHYENLSESDRQAEYFKAMHEVMDKGRNILSKSWETNSLGVSNACLKWRDALISTGWNPIMKQPSERLEVLAQTEQGFHCPSAADRIHAVLALSRKYNPLPEGSEIHVAAPSETHLPPQLAELFANLKKNGAKIVYEDLKPIAPQTTNLNKVQQLILDGTKAKQLSLAEGDSSFEIWHFPTELEAYRYIVTENPKEFNLYINNDGKLFDNVQRMMGQPTSGSSMTSANPQIVQLFRLGLNLFEHPMNIRNMISWLLLPLHPLKAKLRYPLVRKIIETGGIQNEEFKTAIDAYLDSIEDKNERERIKSQIQLYIPLPDQDSVKKTALLTFVRSLGSWSSQMSAMDAMEPIKRAQIAKVANLCDSLTTIIEDCDKEQISFKEIEGWARSLYSSSDFALHDNQAGSRWVVGADDIADDADSCLWTDCYNYESKDLKISFLNTDEQMHLAETGCQFWDVNGFNKASNLSELRPILKCQNRMVVVTVDRVNGERANKHPLLLLLEQTFKEGLANVTKEPTINRKMEKAVKQVDNYDGTYELKIENASRIKMPETESYTSLDKLIQYPLDYVFDRILHFRDRASNELSDIQTVKGNVAHAVIEELFEGTSAEIGNALKNNYEQVLASVIQEKGAVLLLKENTIECRMFHDQLLENLQTLLDIITANKLTVVSREQRVCDHIGLLPTHDPEVKGFIDMVLQNESGEIVVFDFKWTSSSSWHKKLLENNSSVQLALYKHLIEKAENKNVAATAYFTMPRHKLFTVNKELQGKDVVHIEPVNNDSLLEKLINSYRFRRNQLEHGIIENGEGATIEELVYGQKTQELNLVPLTPDHDNEEMHDMNKFSNYSCFKNVLK